MPGIIRTRVGYCGGTTKNPTYDNIGDHAEAIQIDFDPQQISYQDLLKIFATSHNPCRTPYSRQYMSAIWYHNEAQRDAVVATIKAEKERRGQELHTEVGPFQEFTLAEDYHQKYYLQTNRTLKKHFRALYPELNRFIHSTAAARVNGYLGYNGQRADLERELKSLGLSEEARAELARRTEHLE